MSVISPRVSVAMTAAACLLLVAGCGSRPPVVQQPGAAARSAPSTRPITADVKACAGAQAVLGHVAADTVRWSSTLHPFDKAIAKRLVERASELAAQGPFATSPDIQTAVHSTAASFASLGTAMRSKKRMEVARAIGRSQVAYKELKTACSLDQ